MEDKRHTELIASQVAGMAEAVRGLQSCQNDFALDLRNIKENHLAHIERDLAQNRNDLEWLKRFFWLIAGGLIANFAANLAQII